ncbi:MAG: sugar ABC transporter permease [Clostridia bacterium]|nr:sugar ABC transporter permease [Clostridia bacterium]
MRTRKNSKTTTVKVKYNLGEVAQCYGMIGLQIIGFLVITLYPICWAIRLSFFYYNGLPSSQNFIGLENFVTMFTKDADYWRSWLTTIQFALIKLPIELPFAMFVALLLNRKIKFKGFFRSLFFLPCIVGVAVIGLIFSNMFDYYGIINAWLCKIGIIETGITWFSHKWSAMAVLLSGAIWSTFGVNTLYFLAALQNVPQELYEVAMLDGASKFTMFRKITLPTMAPVLQVVVLLSLNGTLHTNEYVLTMTGGGPGGSTYTVMSYIVGKFVPGFAGNSINIGYGCAVSFVTSVIMAVIAIIYMRTTKKLSNTY